MQNQKTLNFIVLLSLFLFLTGFLSRNQSFEKAIAEQKKTGVTEVAEVGQGLPFFMPKTLTPTWKKEKTVAVPTFTLIDQNGQKKTDEIFQNKTTVVGFVFTSCAGFCPMLMNKLKSIENKLDSKTNTQFVVFTVDPDVDTHQKLKSYAKSHKVDRPNWTFLTGSKETIYKLSRDTFASEVRKIDANNLRKFAHTEHFYVIDEDKKLRVILNGTRVDMPDEAQVAINKLRVE